MSVKQLLRLATVLVGVLLLTLAGCADPGVSGSVPPGNGGDNSSITKSEFRFVVDWEYLDRTLGGTFVKSGESGSGLTPTHVGVRLVYPKADGSYDYFAQGTERVEGQTQGIITLNVPVTQTAFLQVVVVSMDPNDWRNNYVLAVGYRDPVAIQGAITEMKLEDITLQSTMDIWEFLEPWKTKLVQKDVVLPANQDIDVRWKWKDGISLGLFAGASGSRYNGASRIIVRADYYLNNVRFSLPWGQDQQSYYFKIPKQKNSTQLEVSFGITIYGPDFGLAQDVSRGYPWFYLPDANPERVLGVSPTRWMILFTENADLFMLNIVIDWARIENMFGDTPTHVGVRLIYPNENAAFAFSIPKGGRQELISSGIPVTPGTRIQLVVVNNNPDSEGKRYLLGIGHHDDVYSFLFSKGEVKLPDDIELIDPDNEWEFIDGWEERLNQGEIVLYQEDIDCAFKWRWKNPDKLGPFKNWLSGDGFIFAGLTLTLSNGETFESGRYRAFDQYDNEYFYYKLPPLQQGTTGIVKLERGIHGAYYGLGNFAFELKSNRFMSWNFTYMPSNVVGN
ncbi:hypothetical protein [Pseudothermotoga thermarum]|uniref:Lipoprotein n=1 Tax=Pseudothermotoga thermarum DSM 5069 TaxID=688269 RepID=F7YUI3_9THEM|nr:hypothetical protein [Pseudothermotoga thermarum]AEH51454.1 hypothetical protein Theth_1392 [Pseudothermotoga thermarum DSM 5069]